MKQPSKLRRFLSCGLWGMTSLVMLNASQAYAREMTQYPIVKLQSLDKGSARTMTFEARVGSTIKFGPLYIKIQTCQKSSPIDQPESAAFLQIWENGESGKSEWVFSGWMFASSPGLSPMDHPVYDVWVINCLDDKPKETVAPPAAPSEEETKTEEAKPEETTDDTLQYED